MLFGFLGFIVLAFIVAAKGRGYVKAGFKEMLGLGKRTLEEGRDGVAKWVNKKTKAGHLLDKGSQTQIAIGRQVRTGEGNFFVCSEGFGLTYDISVAEAVKWLEDHGFKNIVEALKHYDETYFSKEENRKLLEEAIEQDAKDGGNLRVKRIMQEARNKLLTLDLEWVSEETIPLFITYKWALQNIDSVNNKNITDELVLASRKENLMGGWTQEKLMSYAAIVIGILIVGAIAFYIVTMAGNNIPTPSLPSLNGSI